MSREFSTSEIIRQKCSICGSNNKLFTIIKKDNYRGYKLTCCNCNHDDIFLDINHELTIEDDFVFGHVCVQNTTCDHHECPYFKLYDLDMAKEMIDCLINNKKYTTNGNWENIEISEDTKLDINGYNIDPRFH